MNCPHCKQPLSDGMAFCPGCGNQVSQPAYTMVDPYAQQQVYLQQKAAARQSEIQILDHTLRHFSMKQTQYDAYDEACRKLIHYGKGARSALIIWGCIVLTFGLIMLISMISDGSVDDGGVAIAVLSIFPGLGMLIGGILMKLNNSKQLAQCQQEYAAYSQELFYHYMLYPNCCVGPEYSNPRVLQILLRNLNSGRCDSIKESINCMIDASGRRDIDRYCQQLSQQTAIVNGSTGVGAIFIPARLFR